MEAKDIKAGDKFEWLGSDGQLWKQGKVYEVVGPGGYSGSFVITCEGGNTDDTFLDSGIWRRLPSSHPQVRPGQVWRWIPTGAEWRLTEVGGFSSRGVCVVAGQSRTVGETANGLCIGTRRTDEPWTLVSDAPEEAAHSKSCGCFRCARAAHQGANLAREADIAAKMDAVNTAYNDGLTTRLKEQIQAGLRANWTPSYGGNPSVRRYNQRGGR